MSLLLAESPARTATLAGALGALALTAVATVTVAGTAGVTLGAASLSSTGEVRPGERTGILAQTLQDVTLVATGAVAIAGSLEMLLDALSVDARGGVPVPVQPEERETILWPGLKDDVLSSAHTGPGLLESGWPRSDAIRRRFRR